MTRLGENGGTLARRLAATDSRTAIGLSLVSVVSGLALSFFSVAGVLVMAVGAAWYSWLDYRRRPAEEKLKELSDRIDAIQGKINSITMKVYGQ